MSDKTEPKAVSRSVTLREDFWDRVDAHAKATTGDRSTYIRGLIERDLSGAVVSNPTAPDILSALCEQLRPDLHEEFHEAVEAIGIKEPRLLAELIHLVVDYVKNGGDFRGDFDPFIGSTQIPNISKACARGRSRDANADERTPPVRAREEFCDLLRRLADHAALDKPAPGKDLSPLLSDAEKLMKAARDLPSLSNVQYVQFDTPEQAVAEPQSHYGGKIPKQPPRPKSTGTTP